MDKIKLKCLYNLSLQSYAQLKILHAIYFSTRHRKQRRNGIISIPAKIGAG